jgi:hypothetical protein
MPILAVSLSEMTALDNIPDKSKDILLPFVPLRGWVGSHKLIRTLERVEKSIGDRLWIADIDRTFLEEGQKKKALTGDYPREVFSEIERLLNPHNGYENWVNFVEETPNIIPAVQLGDNDQLPTQIQKLNDLGRGIVFRFTISDIDSGTYAEVLDIASRLGIDDMLVVYDYGQVNREVLTFSAVISSLIKQTHTNLPDSLIAISCSSFPSGFSGYNSSENSIYERILYNTVSKSCEGIRMIYSDRGSARADKIGGGGGIPSPRIDYPLPNDWRFIREEFEDFSNPEKGEKELLYTKIAKRIMDEEFWNDDLHVWGTQIIEFTSKGDEYGINSPMKATAARINIHLHQQLYYDSPIELTDTDEDWED